MGIYPHDIRLYFSIEFYSSVSFCLTIDNIYLNNLQVWFSCFWIGNPRIVRDRLVSARDLSLYDTPGMCYFRPLANRGHDV